MMLIIYDGFSPGLIKGQVLALLTLLDKPGLWTLPGFIQLLLLLRSTHYNMKLSNFGRHLISKITLGFCYSSLFEGHNSAQTSEHSLKLFV